MVVVLLIMLLFLPTVVAKFLARNNIDSINSGTGRILFHLGRITLPVLNYLVLPFVVISGNPKMRQSGPNVINFLRFVLS